MEGVGVPFLDLSLASDSFSLRVFTDANRGSYGQWRGASGEENDRGEAMEGAIGGLYASERSASEESLLSFGIDLFPTASV